MISARFLADNLAAAIAAGAWSVAGSEAALRRALDSPTGKWPRRLAEAVHADFPAPVCPAPAELTACLRRARGFALVLAMVRRRQTPFPTVLDGPRFAPLSPFRELDLPAIETPADLADWLGLLPRDLDWLADADGRLARRGAPERRHYVWHWLAKRSGGQRLIEAPKARLKQAQRRILDGILSLVPPAPAACGFVRGRSCRDGAQCHAGEAVVICLDLKDFFLSIPAARVHALFRSLGYPWAVARLLTGLTTVTAPPEVRAALLPGDRFARLPGGALKGPHLPQGAPSSPALANLATRRLDRRLAALARRMGANYTRYADDLTFSGDHPIAFEGVRPLAEIVAEIAAEEGFSLNPAKTRVQRRGGRQVVTGIVVNRHLNLARRDYDRLKAILTNCVRHGPASQNRAAHPAFRAHLEGRVGWAESLNPVRGARLRALCEAIDWADG